MKTRFLVAIVFCAIGCNAQAAEPYKDFGGSKCKLKDAATITKIEPNAGKGLFKGYSSVTASHNGEEIGPALIPAAALKSVKVGTKVCRETLVDNG